MKKKKGLIQKINGLINQSRVPLYLHHFGPKKYTSIQHVKCWLLKEKIGCSWDDFFDDHLEYYPVYEAEEIPDVSTLKKFVKRIPFWIKNLLVALSASLMPAKYGAIDSTGLSRTNASHHYIKRIDREEPIKKSLKLSLFTTGRRILSFKLHAECCHDSKDVPYLIKQSKVLPQTTCMDKAYDANWVHECFRDKGVYSIIPVRKGCVRGRYRKEMRDYFDYSQYWERNCGEWNNSSFKRRFGDYVRSNKFRTQHSEVAGRIILHNLKVVLLRLFHLSHRFNKI